VTRDRKSSTLGLVNPRGSPRYVKGRLPVEHLKVVARYLSFCSDKLIGTIMDLEKFTFNPVVEAKQPSRAFKKNSCLPHPSMMINVSFAYCNIGKSPEYCKGG
jgi:hypothetical protein